MNAYKLPNSGAWQVSSSAGSRLVTQTFYGYTKRDAIAEFRVYLKSLR
jgi:hypothetical protein